jgi:hypothetical protein
VTGRNRISTDALAAQTRGFARAMPPAHESLPGAMPAIVGAECFFVAKIRMNARHASAKTNPHYFLIDGRIMRERPNGRLRTRMLTNFSVAAYRLLRMEIKANC